MMKTFVFAPRMYTSRLLLSNGACLVAQLGAQIHNISRFVHGLVTGGPGAGGRRPPTAKVIKALPKGTKKREIALHRHSRHSWVAVLLWFGGGLA